MQIKRSTAFTLRFEPRTTVDLGSMLRGQLELSRQETMVASSLLTGASTPVSEPELRTLFAVPGEGWSDLAELTERAGLDRKVVESLLGRGLLLSDGDERPDLVALRTDEEKMIGLGWDGFALQYHLTSRQKGVDVAAVAAADTSTTAESDEPLVPFELPPGVAAPVPFAGAASVLATVPTVESADAPPPAETTNDEAMGRDATEDATPVADGGTRHSPRALIDALAGQLVDTSRAHGPAPPHFHRRSDRHSELELPLPEDEGPLVKLLHRRRTTRLFDTEQAMSLEHLAQITYHTYGCHGLAPLAPGVSGMRKTSPSGGALHPIEVYPLVVHVAGIEPGLYHYGVERHALDLLTPLEAADARRLADRFTSGQTYYASGHVLFILTARFERSFWKYRRSAKAYKVIQLDAGHLSQTLYLLATDLGLGAFFTGAVNDCDVEEALGIDGVREGVVGISGCGPALDPGADLGLQVRPYRPRETEI